MSTSQESSSSSTEPVITGKRASIAQAAFEAGFDCSNPDNLLHLIDAVILANNKFNYPDVWDGPAAFQSSIYPDSWTAAHASRISRVSAYEDFEKHPSVPPFGASAADIIRGLVTKSHHASGQNRYPLSERGDASVNKRPAAHLPGNPAKRFKSEVTSSQSHITTSQTYAKSQRHKLHLLRARSNVSNVPKPIASKNPKAQGVRQRAAQTYQAEAVDAGTDALLKKVATHLKANILSINNDRDALRARWEVDQRLRLTSITDYLKALNGYFTHSEEATMAATELVEHYIM
ncbi:MAG: hypothetical protein Q9166_001524 [cf. Caloplaca sp. 2 TL-2023]